MIIFDLDGTLANCEHRRHFVDPNKQPVTFGHTTTLDLITGKTYSDAPVFKPDWKSFYEACDKDEPIQPVIKIITQLLCADGMDEPFDIRIWSARCESVREKTLYWLQDNIDIYGHDTYFFDAILKMRPIGDSTPDDVLKERWLDEYIQSITQTIAPVCEATPYGLVYRPPNPVDFVFDDRKKVRDMWVRRGIFVFDVSQGKGDF